MIYYRFRVTASALLYKKASQIIFEPIDDFNKLQTNFNKQKRRSKSLIAAPSCFRYDC